MEEQFCIHCHWVAVGQYRDPSQACCFAPDNYLGINLVDGSKIYKDKNCFSQRHTTEVDKCGITGKWFKKKELPPVQSYRIDDTPVSPSIGGQTGTNLELVVSKKKVPVLKRLTKEDLENI